MTSKQLLNSMVISRIFQFRGDKIRNNNVWRYKHLLTIKNAIRTVDKNRSAHDDVLGTKKTLFLFFHIIVQRHPARSSFVSVRRPTSKDKRRDGLGFSYRSVQKSLGP